MVIAAIVAGGTGSRMGDTALPKQFLNIGSKPVIIHTVEHFSACPEIDHIVVGIHKDWTGYLQTLLEEYLPGSKICITAGGPDRHATVNNVLEKAKELWKVSGDTVFLTHDAVRPFVTDQIITDNISAAKKYGICGTMIGATDTIVQSADAAFVTGMPVRTEMFQCQTPQSFRYGDYKEVYDSMTQEELKAATDTCKLFFLRNKKVFMVPGDRRNIKITYPLDLKIAELILNEPE